jgi:hypothetical protein
MQVAGAVVDTPQDAALEASPMHGDEHAVQVVVAGSQK